MLFSQSYDFKQNFSSKFPLNTKHFASNYNNPYHRQPNQKDRQRTFASLLLSHNFFFKFSVKIITKWILENHLWVTKDNEDDEGVGEGERGKK